MTSSTRLALTLAAFVAPLPAAACDAGGGEDGDAPAGTTPDTVGGDISSTPAMCAFPKAAATATLDEGLGSAAPSAQASFDASGGLASVDGMSCKVLEDPPVPGRFNPEAHDCAESYTCGQCRFWILSDATAGFILAGDSEEACPSYAGFFLLGEAGTGSDCPNGCPINEYCSNGTCTCPSACREGTVCCGGSICGGDCVGNTCC